MPLSGNVFNRLYSWVADASAGIKIRSDRMDADANDLAGGISAVAARVGAVEPLQGDLADFTDPNLGSGMIGYSGALTYPAKTVGKFLNVWAYDLNGASPRVGLGTAADTKAQFAVESDTTRDGWGFGSPWLFQGVRTVQTNPVPTNPLNYGILSTTTITGAVNQACSETAIAGVATDASNVATYVTGVSGQGTRGAGTAGARGGFFSVTDNATGASLSGATKDAFAIHADTKGNGDDTGLSRIGLQLTANNLSGTWVGPVGTNRHGVGISVSAQSADLKYGYRVLDIGSAKIDIGVSVQTDGSTGIETVGTLATAGHSDNATVPVGFKATGTYSIAAFSMAQNNWFDLGVDTGGASAMVAMRFSSATRKIEFYLGAVRIGYIDITTADHAL